MTINTRTFSRTVSTLSFEHNGEDREVVLMFVPQDYPEPFVEVVGDKLVVAYLVHDDDCANPMTENDGVDEYQRCIQPYEESRARLPTG